MKPFLERGLGAIERIGNKLPDPVSLFAILIVLVMLGSWLATALGVTAMHPGTGETIKSLNLFSAAQLQKLLLEMPQTFAAFPPLGTVLVVMLGIGIADKSGLISAVLRTFVTRMSPSLLSATLVFAGIMSSVAVDAGYVILIPLGALLFYGAGRHPLAGLCATFAGVSAGYTANLLLTALDPILSGLTQAAARLLQPDYTVAVTANYYLMAALVPAFTAIGVLVTEKLVEPYLGPYSGKQQESNIQQGISPLEAKGLLAASAVLLLWIIVVLAWTVPENGLLRSPKGDLTPLYKGMIALMMVGFLLPGIAYGLVTKKIRNDKDAVNMAAETMADMAHYIVLAFMAAHLIAMFQWSNLGIIVAIKGAALLQQLELSGIVLIVSFMFITGLIDLLIGSASAKWALMAPVFVPMLMLLGYPPELTQAAYRIADSVTNVLTPLMPYFPLVLIFGRKYSQTFGVGSLITLMLPYSIGFGIIGTLMLVAWMMFGWPLGPGA